MTQVQCFIYFFLFQRCCDAQKMYTKNIQFVAGFFLALCLSHKTDSMELGVKSLRRHHIWLVDRTELSECPCVCVYVRCKPMPSLGGVNVCEKRHCLHCALLLSFNESSRTQQFVRQPLLCQFGCTDASMRSYHSVRSRHSPQHKHTVHSISTVCLFLWRRCVAASLCAWTVYLFTVSNGRRY